MKKEGPNHSTVPPRHSTKVLFFSFFFDRQSVLFLFFASSTD